MITDTQRTRLYNKKILSFDQFKDMFMDSLLANQETVHNDVFNIDGVFAAKVPIVAGGASNTLSIIGAFRGVTGHGKTINIGALDNRFQNVPVPASAATVFHVGAEQSEVEAEIEINPRTGEAEYRTYTELVGRKGTPTSVTDNGNGTITFNIDSICESGYTYAGRQVRVWLKARSEGGPGPLSPVEAVAIETRTVTYNNPNNTITTAGNFNQTTVSTTAADYVVMMIGPTIKRAAAEDLRATSGCLFLGAVTSVADGNPLVTFDTTDQRVFEFTLAAMGDIFHTAVDEMTRSGVISGFGNGAVVGLNLTINTGVYWMSGHRATYSGGAVACTNNNTGYVYVDTDGMVKYTTSSGVALPRLLLFRVTAAAGSITSVLDVRRNWTRTQSSKGRITVGAVNCDFTTLEGAIAWTTAGTGDNTNFEIMVQDDLTMTATIDIPIKIHIIGTRKGTITTPSNLAAFTVATSVDGVVFRDLQFSIPATPGSCLINIEGAGTCDHWLFENCQFNGGRDGTPVIGLGVGVAASTGSQANWMFRGCQFVGTFNSATPYIAVDGSSKGWTFDGCRFTASTANTGSIGIQLINGAALHKITNCHFEMGGVAIHLKDLNNIGGAGTAVVGTLIQGNTFISSREACILVATGALSQINDNQFIGCCTNGGGANGVIEVSTSSAAKAWIRNNSFDWSSDSAIRITAGNNHNISGNLLATAAAAVIRAIVITNASSLCTVEGNTIDLDLGNTTPGSGKGGASAIDAPLMENGIVANNILLNCGATGSDSSGAIIVGNFCAVHGNRDFYGEGEIVTSGTSCQIWGHRTDQSLNNDFAISTPTRVIGDIEFNDFFHNTEHERSVGYLSWAFDELGAPSSYNKLGYLTNAAGVTLSRAPLDFLKVGDEITYVQVFYNPNGGGNCHPKLRRILLSTGTISDVWTGVADNTGTGIESQNSGAIAHTVVAGYSYFLENLHSGAANRTHGALVRFNRPKP